MESPGTIGDGPPPGVYRARAPVPTLAPFVESMWALEAAAPGGWQELVLPHVHVDVVVLLRGAYERTHADQGERIAGSRVIGLHVSPARYVHSQGDRLLGVRLKPGGLVAFGIGVSHVDLIGAAPHAADVFGPGLDALARTVAEAPMDEALASLERLLVRRVAPPAGHAGLLAALHAVGRGSAITEAAALAGTSVRSFERAVLRTVGLPPRTFRALARFGRAVELLDDRHAREGFAPVLELGYADQAHFIREYRRFAGEAPTTRWPRSRRRSARHAVLEHDLQDGSLGNA